MAIAYVKLKGGVVDTVPDYDVVREVDVSNYAQGSTYRDEWELPSGVNANTQEVATYYPAEGGAAPVTGTPAAKTALLPDTLGHVAPRHELVKQTRLRFYKAVSATVLGYSVAGNTVTFAASPELSPGDALSLHGGVVATGLTEGSIYYVRSVSGAAVTLSATEGGAEVDITVAGSGTTTVQALQLVADYKPQQWLGWSQGTARRY